LQYLFGAFYSDTSNFQPYKRAVLFPVNWDRSSKTRSLAIYGRSTYEILPATKVTVGLRYQHDDQSYRFVFTDGSGTNFRGRSSMIFVTGEASLQHDFTQDIKGYLTYANAQTGKAYDLEDNVGASSTAGLTPLKSEKVQSVEGGFKTQWLDRRLTVNLSAFLATAIIRSRPWSR
jgi:iron complex outermembrane receptor protein